MDTSIGRLHSGSLCKVHAENGGAWKHEIELILVEQLVPFLQKMSWVDEPLHCRLVAAYLTGIRSCNHENSSS